MRHKRRAAIGSVLAATALTLTAIPSLAAAESPAATSADQATTMSAGMLKAMERDLGLTPAQAKARVAAEQKNAVTNEVLSERLSDYAGAWLVDGTTEMVVATSDANEAKAITAAGVTATVVEHSLAELDTVKGALDEAAENGDATGIALSYVDVTTNTVVIETQDVAAGEALVEASGVGADAVKVVQSNEQPKPFYDLVGGDAYYINGTSRCSIGFSVRRGTTPGFVTAGHCGRAGNSTTGYNQVSQGTFQGSIFPSRDMAWVAVNSNWTPRPWVRGTSSTVRGSTQQPVGSSICRSGSTTGWRCGSIQQHNATVFYPQGSVSGLTRTSACAQPGDSGGSFITGTQAQGVTSGGSGNCSTGGTTYHQPVNPILNQWGLTLVTG